MTEKTSFNDVLEASVAEWLAGLNRDGLMNSASGAIWSVGKMCLNCGHEEAAACRKRRCPLYMLGPSLIQSGLEGYRKAQEALDKEEAARAPESAAECETRALQAKLDLDRIRAERGEQNGVPREELYVSPNKATAELKDMILEALSESGGVAYLVEQAQKSPAAFLALVGKVFPLQVTGGPVQIETRRSLSPLEVMDELVRRRQEEESIA